MHKSKIAHGLWRWTAFHAEWNREVGCVALETDDGVVLIDPLVPEGEQAKLWSFLETDLGAKRAPVHILITIYWHARSTREVAKRYRARVWAPSRLRAAIARRAGRVTDIFRPGDPLPGGIEAFATARGGEVVLWLPDQRALVTGDALLGKDGGGLRLCPASWVSDRVGLSGLADSLRPLLDLPVERVLVSHGEPVLARGRAALRRALDASAPRRHPRPWRG